MKPWFYVGQDPYAQRADQIAVLGIEIRGFSGAYVTEAAARFAQELTDSLRRNAAPGPYAVATGDPQLIDLKLMYDCPDERLACMQHIGRVLKVGHLLYGHAQPRGTRGYQVTLRLLDVDRGQSASWTDLIPASASSGPALSSHARRGYAELLASSRPSERPATTDAPLIRATNEAFWQLTKYKRGQKLDMSDPKDREMSKTWSDLYAQIKGHRDRATSLAKRTLNETVTPYVLVIEQRDGSLRPQPFERRSNLDVQYTWLLDQPDYYTYLAMFDFTQNRDAPIADEFSLSKLSRVAASGYYEW